jgi:pimeloyl-ACP methyl ester carboxylesterase
VLTQRRTVEAIQSVAVLDQANALEDRALEQHTKARQSVGFKPVAAVPFAPVAGAAVHLLQLRQDVGGYKSFTPTVVETNKKYADFGAVAIDGVGHYPMLEKPDEFNRKLRDVLKEFATRK